MENVPITEMSNPITAGIDCCNSTEMVKMFYSSDKQIFDGWGDNLKIKDQVLIDRIAKVSAIVAKFIKECGDGEEVKVVLSGCGTSGRLAFLTSRAFNRHLISQGRSPVFTYLIAGGDKALFTSQEAPEDDPAVGRSELIEVTQRCQSVLYVGITCGLSAAYVAGQLDHCLSQPHKFTPVLIGFNPVHLARQTPIKSWNKTVHDVVSHMVHTESAVVINPVVGPESISGSSRMKGGSATKIILEMIYLMSLEQPTTNTHIADVYRSILDSYKRSCDHLYSNYNQEIARLIDMVGQSLNSGGRVVYAGADVSGIIAMIDASECVPTFGSDINDVRGYLDGGYELLHNRNGDLSHLGSNFDISWNEFCLKKLEGLGSHDIVLVVNTVDSSIRDGLSSFTHTKAKVIEISIDVSSNLPTSVKICAPASTRADNSVLQEFIRQLTVKLVCNCVSTGAHITKGKVFSNIMIDVRLSNRKLYARAVDILMKMCSCGSDTAVKTIRSVVLGDVAEHQQLREDEVIERATVTDLVLPTAILMLLAECSLLEAQGLLATEPIVRKAVNRYYTPSI